MTRGAADAAAAAVAAAGAGRRTAVPSLTMPSVPPLTERPAPQMWPPTDCQRQSDGSTWYGRCPAGNKGASTGAPSATSATGPPTLGQTRIWASADWAGRHWASAAWAGRHWASAAWAGPYLGLRCLGRPVSGPPLLGQTRIWASADWADPYLGLR